MLRFALCALLSMPFVHAALRAGAASQILTPDLAKFSPVYMAGFGNNRIAKSVHDDLFARCLALEPGRSAPPVVLCGVDLIGLFSDDVDRIQKSVNEILGHPVNLTVASLHVHEGPDTMGLWGPKEGVSGIDEAYNSLVVERTAQAAADAVLSLRPATIRLAKTHPAELDSFIDDSRPPVVHDAEILVLSATGVDGKPIATLLNWANHPETLGSRNTAITSDYSGFLRDELERRLGGVAVFINGAVGGMQSPLGAKVVDPATHEPAPENSFRKAEILGRRVADLAADALRHATPAPFTSYALNQARIQILTTNEGFLAASTAGVYKGLKQFSSDLKTTVPVGAIHFSAAGATLLEIALVPGELYPELSVGGIERYSGADFRDAPAEPAIKQLMHAPFRMLFGLANDEIGYIIPKAEWDNEAPWLNRAPKRWYGEVNSVGPDAAPGIAAAMAKFFAQP